MHPSKLDCTPVAHQVGSVLNVRPSLERVDVLVEVGDTSSVIPRNSVVEANQSGLIAEPLVDITPQASLFLEGWQPV